MTVLLLKHINLLQQKPDLNKLLSGKLLINTINAYSYNLARKDELFATALLNGDVLLPDGISVVWGVRFLVGHRLEKIAGEDLFFYEMNRLQELGGTCLFLGSSEQTLDKIRARAAVQFPQITTHIYSPPFKSEFTEEENNEMIELVNSINPDVLFVGMTAPKQEKWAYKHFDKLNAGHVCCIGAVFDFYAGTVKRAPQWMIGLGLEWLYRLVKEPKRMWRRYLIGNMKFIGYIIKEKYGR